MASNEIHGGEVLIFGDLHFSDVYTGKHKDYLSNCCTILNQLEAIVKERKPSACVLLGDLVGWNETNIKSREVFAMFCGVWRRISDMCTIYAVRGNHDMRGYPDFNFLMDLGLIQVPNHLDYYSKDGKHLARFHMVGYGCEHNPLDYAPEGVSNVVLGHNNYTISGCTTWYADHDGIEVNTLSNYCGIELIVSGHIHAPSPELYATTMPDGSNCCLFYLGCPTRPQRETYDACWYMGFYESVEDKECVVDYETYFWELAKCSEIYYEDEEFINEKTEDELAESIRKENLANVLQDIIKYRMYSGDPREQIKNIPDAKPEAIKTACEYLDIVMRG